MWSWVPRQIAAALGVLAVSAVSQSCLIAAPDPLEKPQRIPPRLIGDTAIPSLTRIVQTRVDGETTFSVRFVSEDLGEPIVAKLYLNYPDGLVLGGDEEVPSELENEREMSVPWTDSRDIPAGCYTVTMAITHQDNYTARNRPRDESKTAFLTWWIAHDTDPQLVNLDECTPPQTQAQ